MDTTERKQAVSASTRCNKTSIIIANTTVHLRSRGVSDCDASLSNMCCNGGCSGWASSAKEALAWLNNSWGRPLSHRICWLRSVFSKDFNMYAINSCSSKDICNDGENVWKTLSTAFQFGSFKLQFSWSWTWSWNSLVGLLHKSLLC